MDFITKVSFVNLKTKKRDVFTPRFLIISLNLNKWLQIIPLLHFQSISIAPHHKDNAIEYKFS